MDTNMTTGTLSILIPTYEMGGVGAAMLQRALDSIAQQRTFGEVDVEIVVADHSVDTSVQLVTQRFAPLGNMSIRYVRNERRRGSSSANLNRAFSESQGEFIKVLFQDDFLLTETALLRTVSTLRSTNSQWLICGTTHTRDGANFFGEMIPAYHDRIHLGRNTVSSPSVLAMRRSAWLDFDPKLIWLMDVDVYRRLRLRCGLPTVLTDILVANGIGDHQVTNTRVSLARKLAELSYVSLKHAWLSLGRQGNGET